MLEVPFLTSIRSQHCRAKKRRKVRGFPSKFDPLFSHFHYLEASRSHVWLCTVPAQLLLYFICRPSRFILRCCGLISFSNRPREEKKREKEPHTQKKMVGRRRQKDPSVLFLFLRLLRAVVFIIYYYYLLPRPPPSLGLARLLLHDRPGANFRPREAFDVSDQKFARREGGKSFRVRQTEVVGN